MKRNISINLAAALCCAASTGLADFAIDVDLSASTLTVEIAPHTVQSVTVLTRNAPENR